MKALEILKTLRDNYYDVYERGLAKKEDVLKYDDAIAELEETMKPKTCETCKYNKEIDGFMVFCEAKNVDGFIVGWHGNTKDYCCNRYESKDKE